MGTIAFIFSRLLIYLVVISYVGLVSLHTFTSPTSSFFTDKETFAGFITTTSVDSDSPSAPTNLRFTNKSETTVDLLWSAATDNIAIESYDIYQNGVLISSTTTTTFHVSGLAENTTYTFEVVAKDAAGNQSIASNLLIVTTNAAQYIIEILDQNNEVTLRFTPKGSQSSFVDLHYDVEDGTQQNVRMNADGGTWEYTIGGLSAGDTIDYSFTYTLGGQANDTPEYSYTVGSSGGSTPDAEPPTAPTNLTYIQKSDSTVTIAWDAATDNIKVVEYDIYQDGEIIASTVSTVYHVTELTNNSTYSFKVIAKDAAGNESNASDLIEVTTDEEPIGNNDYIIVEDEYTIEVIDHGNEVTIMFNPTNGVSDFVDLHYAVNGGVQQNVRMNENEGQWEYTIIDLSEGDTIDFSYTYTLGQPAYESDQYSYIVGLGGGIIRNDTEAPAPPNNLIVSAKSATTIMIIWDESIDNVGVVNYDIYQNGVYIDSTTLTNYEVIGLTENTTYSFTVIAKDESGNQSTGSTVDVLTDTADIVDETIEHEDFTIEMINNGDSATFIFTPNIAGTSFVDLHYTINGAQQQNIATANNDESWVYTINDLTNGDIVLFFYTYSSGTAAFDSDEYEYTH
ncbi:fibronectin type III domain-containing protein [Cytobacillus sp. IB215316]|uniref:fibronectin type III domain-containing protein n=1 Tax=Cytobacillus sp. IB215316 TaxID=3097354 RepID=UPI002A132E38|nr:fibronectin type III domain-containing protein [Cytobacillus sp. IB215316]MDX8360800.1 fibronectin type III domain-containing protein [Cytobacillus sp. IB215316]